MSAIRRISLVVCVLGIIGSVACGGGGGGGGGGGDGGSGASDGRAGEGGGTSGGTGGSGGTAGAGGTGGGGGVAESIVVRGTLPMEGSIVIMNRDVDNFVAVGPDLGFSFEDVVPPYELIIALPMAKTVLILRGMTLEELNFADRTKSATVIGQVNGVPSPLPVGHSVWAAFSDPNQTFFVAGDGKFNTTIGLRGDGPRDIEIVAVLVKYSGAAVGDLQLLKAGKTKVRLEPGESLAGINIDLDKSVETREVSPEIEMGAYQADRKIRLSEAEVEGIPVNLPFLFNFPVHLPIGGALVVVEGKDENGTLGSWAGVPKGKIQLPTATGFQALLPPDEATGVSKAPIFAWTSAKGANAYYRVNAMAENGVILTILLPPDENRFAMPDLSRIGCSPGGEVKWTVSTDISSEGPVSLDRVISTLLEPPARGPLSEITETHSLETREQRFVISP